MMKEMNVGHVAPSQLLSPTISFENEGSTIMDVQFNLLFQSGMGNRMWHAAAVEFSDVEHYASVMFGTAGCLLRLIHLKEDGMFNEYFVDSMESLNVIKERLHQGKK